MILAVAVLCSIVLWTHCLHFTDVQPQQDFDLQQFAGEWYRVGIAYESPAFIKYKDQVMTSKGLLVPNENGGANLTMWNLLGSKGCFPSFYVYEKTDVPGLFTYFSQRHKMMKDITVVDTNYTDYGIVLKYKKMDKEYTQVALYGRTPVLGPELIEKFKSIVLSLGFSEEAIAVPVTIDPCPFTEPSNATETMT